MLPSSAPVWVLSAWGISSVHLGLFSALGGYHQWIGGYDQCTGGIMSALGDIMICVGDIISPLGDVQWIGGTLQVHLKNIMICGGISSVHWGYSITILIFPNALNNPQCADDIPPMNWTLPMHCTTLMHCIHIMQNEYRSLTISKAWFSPWIKSFNVKN